MLAISVREILANKERLALQLLNPGANLDIRISENDLNRPGLALTGFFDFFAHTRVQIFGQGEWSYLHSLKAESLATSLTKFFAYDLTCLVFTHENRPPQEFLDEADEHRIPVLMTKYTTHKFIGVFSDFLDEKLAPKTTVHGVLAEVFGVGILLQGKSGVGKSETALELVERGHRLVADDIVEIRCRDESRLYGYVSETIEHHMEIRGLGIIGIKELFGSGSVRRSKRIDLIINLEDWDEETEYDRLGLDQHAEEILSIRVPAMVLPIRPGRNIPILVETAAKNHRLKMMGYHPAEKFNQRLQSIMLEKSRGVTAHEEQYGDH